MNTEVKWNISSLPHATGLKPLEYERAEIRPPKAGERYIGHDYSSAMHINEAPHDFNGLNCIVLIPKARWITATVEHLANQLTGKEVYEWRFNDYKPEVAEWIGGLVAIGYNPKVDYLNGDLPWIASNDTWYRSAQVKVN